MKTCHAALTLLSMDKFLKRYHLHKNPWKDIYLTPFFRFERVKSAVAFLGEFGAGFGKRLLCKNKFIFCRLRF